MEEVKEEKNGVNIDWNNEGRRSKSSLELLPPGRGRGRRGGRGRGWKHAKNGIASVRFTQPERFMSIINSSLPLLRELMEKRKIEKRKKERKKVEICYACL